MATLIQKRIVADHFITAALWADAPEGTHPRVTKRARQVAVMIADTFISRHPELFEEAMQREEAGYGAHHDAGSPEAAFGHDLWLTLCGHGVGFWDRNELDADGLGQRLTDACRAFGEPYLEFYRGWMNLSHEVAA